jgi:hypothetical protein
MTRRMFRAVSKYCLLPAAYCLLIGGCSTPGPQLRTPKPEQIAVPPEDDPRYSKAFEYPKEMLNKPPVKPSTPNSVDGMKGRPSMGGGGMPSY